MDIITAYLGAKMAHNDLKANGQIGYTEYASPVVLVPEASYEFYDGMGGAPIAQQPKAGDEITLTLDGEVYTESVKETYLADLGGSLTYIGNAVLLGGADTGESYSIAFAPNYDDGSVSAATSILAESGNNATTTHTMSLTWAATTVHRIAEKYLPSTVTIYASDIIGAYWNDETPPALDGGRLKAFLDGFSTRNLAFTHTYTDSDDTETSYERAIGYNLIRVAAGFTVYQVAILLTRVQRIVTLEVSVFTDGTNEVFVRNNF